MNIRIIILLSLIVIIGCQNVNRTINNNLKTFALKDFTKTTEVKLSDLGFVDIKYIPLETNEYSLVPRILDIKIDSSFYLIQFFNTILKFQNNGSFVTKIGTEGRGPGEYLVVHDVDIDQQDHFIYLVDGWARRFYVYSESGEFLRTFKSPLNAINFKITKDGILCFSTNYIANVDTSYVLIKTNGQIVKSFSNKYPWNYIVQRGTTVFTENIFYRFNNQLFKKEVYSDTVYLFEDKGFKPHFTIEHGERLLTPYARSNYDWEYLIDNFISQKKIFEFGDYIYYEFGIERTTYIFLGSKEDDFNAFIRYDQGLINDLDGGPSIRFKTIKDDNTVITWIDALRLKNYIVSEEFIKSKPKFPEKKKELEDLANSLKETDNPVLILVSLKK
ncbi:MAG: 6-bladed beta-propeller [Bacteroidales bacterium]|nr:6-bladed beta-propeller [Bacteroidales bacterium]